MSKDTKPNAEPYDTSHLIRQGDFCEITTDSLTEYGLKRGNHVFIAGMKAVPDSIEDPYTQRLKCLVHPSSKKGEIDTTGFMMVDPRSLSKVAAPKQDAMMGVLQAQMDEMALIDAESPSEADH